MLDMMMLRLKNLENGVRVARDKAENKAWEVSANINAKINKKRYEKGKLTDEDIEKANQLTKERFAELYREETAEDHPQDNLLDTEKKQEICDMEQILHFMDTYVSGGWTKDEQKAVLENNAEQWKKSIKLLREEL